MTVTYPDFRIETSPLVPPGQIILFDPATVTLPPLDWGLPEPPLRDHPPTSGLFAAEVAQARGDAFAHLDGLLDGMCDTYGIDREVWRAPRREVTAAAIRRRDTRSYLMEARLALTIPRAQTFAVVTGACS